MTEIQLNRLEFNAISKNKVSDSSTSIDSPASDTASSVANGFLLLNKQKRDAISNDNCTSNSSANQSVRSMSSSTVTVSSGRGNSFSDFENQIHALNHHRIVSSSSENELGATEKDDFIFKMKKCPASKKFKITNSIKEVNNEFSSDSEEETPLKKTYSRLAKDKKRATNNSNLTVKENYSSPKQPEEEDSDDDDGDYNVMDHFRIIHKGAPIVKCNEDDL